jgi:hypothetical protein
MFASISTLSSLRWPIFLAAIVCFLALLVSPKLAQAQFTQQGPKLVGTGAVGGAGQGGSVALSADGNTAIVGGPRDDSNPSDLTSMGAVWVYTRSNGVWTQQGSKLVGTGAVGAAGQGSAVTLSADGNTALVGGSGDEGNNGAAWVFTRSNGVWTQQGNKLVGTGAVGAAGQGSAVALSAETPPSSAGLMTTSRAGRRGSTPAAMVSGPSRAASWSVPVRLEPSSTKANPSRCPATATPPSWAGLETTSTPTPPPV